MRRAGDSLEQLGGAGDDAAAVMSTAVLLISATSISSTFSPIAETELGGDRGLQVKCGDRPDARALEKRRRAVFDAGDDLVDLVADAVIGSISSTWSSPSPQR